MQHVFIDLAANKLFFNFGGAPRVKGCQLLGIKVILRIKGAVTGYFSSCFTDFYRDAIPRWGLVAFEGGDGGTERLSGLRNRGACGSRDSKGNW